MIAVDWSRVAAMGVLAAAILTGWASIALLYAVLFVVNAGEIVFRSASQAILPAVVPSARLERANGWLAGGDTLMEKLIAGPLGGFLFVIAAGLPFLVNAGTYAASAILLGWIGGTYRPHRESGEASSRPGSVWADVAEGFRWLIRQRLLRTMAVLIGLLNLTLTGALAVLVLLARERLHLGSVGYGLLFTCAAAGGLLSTALRQRLTPPAMLGRVGSTTLFIAAGGNCVGALIAGGLASKFGITAPYWAGFAVAVIVSATTWRVFNRVAVAAAYATPVQAGSGELAATP